MDSRNVTMVDCGSLGRPPFDPEDLVEGAAGFFLPNRFPSMMMMDRQQNESKVMMSNGFAVMLATARLGSLP